MLRGWGYGLRGHSRSNKGGGGITYKLRRSFSFGLPGVLRARQNKVQHSPTATQPTYGMLHVRERKEGDELRVFVHPSLRQKVQGTLRETNLKFLMYIRQEGRSVGRICWVRR